VEAGLLELLFDIDLALLHERKQVATGPGDLGEGEAVFGDVDGLASEVWRGGVAFGGRCIAVDVHKVLLELDGADGGVDLQGSVKVRVVGAGHRSEELRGPGTAVAAIYGEALVYLEGVAERESDKKPVVAHVQEVIVVLNAAEAVAVRDLILVDENLVGAFEGWRDDETAALVVERRKDDRCGGCLFDAVQLRPFGGGADDADDRDGRGCGLVRGLRGLVELVGPRCAMDGCGRLDGYWRCRSFQEVGGGGFLRRRVDGCLLLAS